MAVSIRAVEKNIDRERAKIALFRHQATCFEEGTPAHQAAVGRLQAPEGFVIADTKLVAFLKRRLN
jgi:hypothetical protein